MRRICDLSFHRFRQEGLDLITFNVPPAITFPVDQFPLQVNVHVCVLGLMSICQKGKKERERKGGGLYVFMAGPFAVDEMLWKLWAPSSVF